MLIISPLQHLNCEHFKFKHPHKFKIGDFERPFKFQDQLLRSEIVISQYTINPVFAENSLMKVFENERTLIVSRNLKPIEETLESIKKMLEHLEVISNEDNSRMKSFKPSTTTHLLILQNTAEQTNIK